MSQASIYHRQKTDCLGSYEDHIQEIMRRLGLDFNIRGLTIETPEQALEAVNNIKSMLTMLEKKKKIVRAASQYGPLDTNSDKEEINLSLF